MMTNKKVNQPKNSYQPLCKEATAPYNFIPLNDKVVTADTNPNDLDFNKYHLDRNTGYIDLTIKALTPVYIRGTRSKNDDKNNSSPKFFSPTGQPAIPGSSIKGMVRNLIEIISHSKMEFLDKDVKYHFRSFADYSIDLRNEFKNMIIGGDPNTGYYTKANGGYIKKIGINEYVIHPAKTNPTHFRVEEDLAIKAGVINKRMKDNDYKPMVVEVYFKSEPEKKHNHSQPLRYAKVIDIMKAGGKIPDDFKKGWLVCSGFIGQKSYHPKHMHWVIGEIDMGRSIKILPEAIENYKKDEWRKSDNILEKIKGKNQYYPCFYTTNGNFVNSFGNTGFYRVPYRKKVGDLLPSVHNDKNIIDITTAIFGNEKDFSGRVFFCDAKVISKENCLLPTVYPKILSGPKPTSFQLYLEQHNPNYSDPKKIKNLKNYNSPGAIIRGYKLYWHNSKAEYEQKDMQTIEKHKTQYTKITPVKTGTIFKGRIYFENLSDIELGALFFSLDLPEALAHKIGMAKPLGLGSVKITPALYLSDRKKRYSDFFAEIEGIEKKENIQYYKSAFENYVLSQLNSNVKTLWDIDRMRKLKILIDFKNQKPPQSIEYMKLEEFRARAVLPTPDKV